MKCLIGYLKKDNCKIFIRGNALMALIILVSMSKTVAEKVAKEKDINLDSAMDFVINCIRECSESLDASDKY